MTTGLASQKCDSFTRSQAGMTGDGAGWLGVRYALTPSTAR